MRVGHLRQERGVQQERLRACVGLLEVSRRRDSRTPAWGWTSPVGRDRAGAFACQISSRPAASPPSARSSSSRSRRSAGKPLRNDRGGLIGVSRSVPSRYAPGRVGAQAREGRRRSPRLTRIAHPPAAAPAAAVRITSCKGEEAALPGSRRRPRRTAASASRTAAGSKRAVNTRAGLVFGRKQRQRSPSPASRSAAARPGK